SPFANSPGNRRPGNRRPGNRRIVWTAACIAGVGIIAVGFPQFGVPLALGIAGYTLIKLSKPHAILRGRTLHPHQQHRAALIAGGGMLGIAALFSGTFSALDLANTLEHRLDDALKAAHRRGELKTGQIFEACNLACGRAVVLELPTPDTPGIAKLSGFARHERSIYQWRNSPGGSETGAAQRL